MPNCHLKPIDARQKRKLLPFRKLQPPKKEWRFSCSLPFLPSRISSVLLFFHVLATWNLKSLGVCWLEIKALPANPIGVLASTNDTVEPTKKTVISLAA